MSSSGGSFVLTNLRDWMMMSRIRARIMPPDLEAISSSYISLANSLGPPTLWKKCSATSTMETLEPRPVTRRSSLAALDTLDSLIKGSSGLGRLEEKPHPEVPVVHRCRVVKK